MSFKTFCLVAAILLSQILIFNHLHIEEYGMPLFCILPLLWFPQHTRKWLIIVSGFCIGLLEDMFINTPGVTAATFTLIGLLQPFLLQRFTGAEEEEKLTTMPTAYKLGWWTYSKYVITTVLLACTVFYTLEYFSFFHFDKYLLSIASSTVITTLLICAAEGMRKKK